MPTARSISELTGALEDGEHERVDDPGHAHDHGEREQHVEHAQELLELPVLLVDPLLPRLHAGVRVLLNGSVDGLLVRLGRSARHLEERELVALDVEERVERPLWDRHGAEQGVERRWVDDALHLQLGGLAPGRLELERVSDLEVLVLGEVVPDDRPVPA
jgi:hypothetical protein